MRWGRTYILTGVDGNILIAVIALVINLITIIKFTNSLENRLTKLETVLESAIKPNIKRIEMMLAISNGRNEKYRSSDETRSKK